MKINNMHSIRRIVLAALLFACGAAELRAASMTLADFDEVSGNPFSFKDEKGTRFKISTPRSDSTHKKVLSIDYKIATGGWGGWGLGLGKMNASSYAYLSFTLRGEGRDLKFDVGMKDASNIEKKLPVADYAEAGKEWGKVRIPLKDFSGINLNSLDNINFGFSDASGEGEVFVDDIQFETGDLSEEARLQSGSFSNKVLVDGFERANPADLYLVYEGDESSLKVNSSRIVKDGDYALELEYQMSTTRPWGSWVSAEWHAKETTLDWRGVRTVRLWVKGDGSGNILRFVVTDSDGEKWVCRDEDALKSTRWEAVEMPIEKFELMDKAQKRNQTFDLHEVRGYALQLAGSGGSTNTSGVKTSVGKIQVDQLTLLGEGINTVWAVPPTVSDSLKARMLKVGNIDLNGLLFTEYLYTPEKKSEVSHYGKIFVNGKIGNYSARFEFGSEGQEFGDSSYYSIAESTVNSTTIVNRQPNELSYSVQGFANNVSPYLTQVTMGNVFVDYSPFTFAPVFGFKGMSLEGDFDVLNYHAFVLKHKFDSFTLGSRLKATVAGVRMTGISVYYKETARVSSPAKVVNGSLQTSPYLQQEEAQNDWVYTAEADRPFLEEKISFGGTIGYNRYNRFASIDRANPYDPVFVSLLEQPISVDDHMFRARAALNGLLIPGLKMNYEYRDVGKEFKPRYRQNPVSFDDLESDQRGHNARLVQTWRGFNASLEYDNLRRVSDNNHYRHRINWALGYYGFDKLDVAFNQEIRRETYRGSSTRTDVLYDKNERVVGSEVYIRLQMSQKTAVTIVPRREDIWHPASGATFVTESVYSKLEYSATSNLKVMGEFRTSHYSNKDFEPTGAPYSDNFLRLKVEFNF